MTPGFQHYVAVVPETYRDVMPFSNSVAVKKIRKKIPFRSSRKRQKSAIMPEPWK